MTGASSPGGSEPAFIGVFPITSFLTRSINPLAFETTRPVAASTRAAYDSIAPCVLDGRGARRARAPVARVSGGFDARRDALPGTTLCVCAPTAGARAAPGCST